MAPCQGITLVQHNSLGSWNVFLSLLNSFVGLPPVDIVMLQDPPSREGFLPSFAGFKSCCPPSPKPAVAFYVSLSFLSFYTVLPVASPSSMEVFQLDIYTPSGCFGTGSPKFIFTNIYSRSFPRSVKSVDPLDALPNVDFPCLVAEDFNIHNHAVDCLRVISRSEEKASTPYFDRASDLAYSLLNTPGVYTRFPLSGTFRPSAIDLSFANPRIRPAFLSWETTSLPSTESGHVPILIQLAAPSNERAPPRPMWNKADLESLEKNIKALPIPPAPHQQKKNVRPANCVRVRTPGVRPARPVRLVRLNSPFIALWRPLRCNTPHFCSFLCGSVRSPLPPLTPSIYFLPSSLRPITSHFCSFLCGSVRSPLPPDAIHLPPYRISCTPQPPTFALFFADPSAVRSPSRHHSSSY